MNATGMIRLHHGTTIAVMMNRHAGTTRLVAEITVKKAIDSGADPEKKQVLPTPEKQGWG
jgi:hypothetical protein